MSTLPPFKRPSASDPYLAALAKRALIFDGATGTNLQLENLTAADFGGDDLEGCNELLVLTRPDAIERLHRSFLDVGVDVIETNSFGSFSIVLAEYGIPEQAHELAITSAQIARRVADEYSTSSSPKFVAGSIGPGTKFPTLGQISYDELSASYEELAYGLLEGGVDLLLVETMFDLLSGKAAINACHRAMARHGRIVPIQAQVTIELTGRMLPGTEIGSAITSLLPLGVDVLGLNCATGPVEMHEPLRQLSDTAPVPLACLPNAGLPSVVDGKMHYDLTPDGLAEHLARHEKVPDVVPAVPAGDAGAALLQRPLVAGVPRVPQPHHSPKRVDERVATAAGGQHAIEHIDARRHRQNDVLWLADSHEIARFVGGKVGNCGRQGRSGAEGKLKALAKPRGMAGRRMQEGHRNHS
jgi:methionine synthase I (cobalamin-dependent)